MICSYEISSNPCGPLYNPWACKKGPLFDFQFLFRDAKTQADFLSMQLLERPQLRTSPSVTGITRVIMRDAGMYVHLEACADGACISSISSWLQSGGSADACRCPDDPSVLPDIPTFARMPRHLRDSTLQWRTLKYRNSGNDTHRSQQLVKLQQNRAQKTFCGERRQIQHDLKKLEDGLQCSQDKIHQGLRVHMDVRGSSALMHVIRALCSVKAGHICGK